MSDEMSIGLLDKVQPFVLIAAVIVGLIFGSIFTGFSNYAESILYFVIILLVYSIMLGVPHEKIWSSFKNIKFFSVAIFSNFVIIPLVAWGLALIFLRGHPAVFIGFILYLVTPCTDWFLVFTSMAKGDVPLGLALLPVNLILQILLIPVYLFLFAGKLIPIQFSALGETFLVFILLPFVLAILTRFILTKIKTHKWAHKFIDSILSPFQTVILTIVLFVMFAGNTQIISDNFGPLSLVFIPILIFFVLSFAMAQLFSKLSHFNYKECALLTCTTTARNSPLSLAIAIGIFPGQPLIHVAIIIGVLIELPLLIIVVKALGLIRKKYY